MNTRLHDADSMLNLLASWVARGWLREVDLALTRFIADETPGVDGRVLLATALVSHQLGRGHVCLDLDQTLADPYMALSLPPEHDSLGDDPPTLPETVLQELTTDDWCTVLSAAQAVNEDPASPLVLNGQRLYLRRYWRYERQVEQAIVARLTQSPTRQLSMARSRQALSTLFPAMSSPQEHPDWQKIACALATRSAFTVITGGPGTGKTTTVVRLLALLQHLSLSEPPHRSLHIRLAAPTGKAAARLKESISSAIADLPTGFGDDPVLCASIPTEATTLHRLLGSRPDSRLFRHDARHPLALDVLVIDEASMIDLEMMAAVLAALPADARLILLGDKDQLASVEAGSVLGELCACAEEGRFNPHTAAWVQDMTGTTLPAALCSSQGRELDQQVIMLRESRRFKHDSGIGKLARAVNHGDTSTLRRIWTEAHADLDCLEITQLDDIRLTELLTGSTGHDGYGRYLQAVHHDQPDLMAPRLCFDDWARTVLERYADFQLLTALRNGPHGVSGLNEHITRMLAAQGLIHPERVWYAGRPVLVTRNDYGLSLMNGDIGITLPFPARDTRSGDTVWSTRVAFLRDDGSIHWVLPSRLQAVETVFAMTVHKSQGSEFRHCALLLPPERNPVLTRELLYTGITRARSRFTLICTGRGLNVAAEAASRRVQRSGGLFADEIATP